jgi:hypothetical protein
MDDENRSLSTEKNQFVDYGMLPAHLAGLNLPYYFFNNYVVPMMNVFWIFVALHNEQIALGF